MARYTVSGWVYTGLVVTVEADSPEEAARVAEESEVVTLLHGEGKSEEPGVWVVVDGLGEAATAGDVYNETGAVVWSRDADSLTQEVSS